MIKKISNVLLMLLIGFFPGVLFPSNNSITKIGEWGTGNYLDVAVQNNYAYCAAGYAGLDIIDISNASLPKKTGNYNTPGLAAKVFVMGNYAYVADSHEGLQVIDVSNPYSPTLAGHYYREGEDWWSAEAVYVKGKYAYVTSECIGLDIIDISNPSSPTPVGSYDIYEIWNYDGIENVFGVAVSNNYAYITLRRISSWGDKYPEYTGEMHIIDISVPSSPQFAGMYGNLDAPSAIQVKGNFAYIGDGSIGLVILDITDPSNPNLVGTHDSRGIIRDLAIDGNYAYLARYNDGLRVIDISTPTSPTTKGDFDTPGSAEGVYVSGNYAYCADQNKGLQVINISNPSAPAAVGNYDTSGNLVDIYVRGNYAYAADYRSGLQILDVSSPSAPTWVSTYDISSETQGVFVKGNYAYAADSEKGLHIIDVSNPAAPFLKGKYKGPGYPSHLYVSGNYAYVTNNQGLQVIDVSNPSSPTLVGFIDTNCIAYNVSVSGNYAYIADYDEGLLIIDISNPSSPTLVNSYKNPSGLGLAQAVHVVGHYAYLASEYRGLDVIDVLDPASPLGVGYCALGDSAKGIYVKGNYAYVAYLNELVAINISNPSTPTLAASYPTSSDENEKIFVADNGNLIYMTGGESGKLFIFDLDESSTPPQIKSNRDEINFGSVIQGDAVGPQSLLISNGGGGTLNWSVSVNQSWLRCTPGSGTGNAEISVSVEAAGLPAGTYHGIIAISDPRAANSPLAVEATLYIYNTGQTSEPFGVFATPLEGAMVSGSIPVTGWALDDIDIVSVQIFRVEGKSSVYIGDAVFVEGARPDVERAYPGYPMNYKAGWGYMLLTNFLPNGGNGTFTLLAAATDVEGHQVSLGMKTIICDNAHAMKPFGAIDTPTQGGSAAGSEYLNWGWALTPLPNTIPTDGSTIRVWVDGVMLGSPVYNLYREDIATLFPGYNNSSGAVAYFYLDTTQYENGLHTIAWSVTDNAGNTDGIGSRYFTIQNLSGIDEQGELKDIGVMGEWNNGGMGLTPAVLSSLTRNPDMDLINTFEPLRLQKGYNPESEPGTIFPDENGQYTIEIKELERLVIYLEDLDTVNDNVGGGSRTAPTQKNIRPSPGIHYDGYLVNDDQLKPLPIGSTFDHSRGIFYWQPGPGFIGEYRFVFFQSDPGGKINKRNIVIRILP